MAIERRKGGRPKKADQNVKSERIVFLTNKADSILISEKAKAMNLSVSEYCNRAIKETEIVALFSEDEIKLKLGLIGMANNLNQIAHRANAAGIETVTESARELFKKMIEELEKFRK